jgi:hypothetical protein
MDDVQDQPVGKSTKYSSAAQTTARRLLRRLMAERNIRTTQMATVLGEEAHTIRRALNGSRTITLDEVVLIASLGGYSLDEHLLGGGGATPRSAAVKSGEPLENSLSRVFAAIADLLANNGGMPSSSSFKPLEMSELPDRPERRSKQQPETDTPRRPRGRPRKTSIPPDELPGPQW